MWKIQTIRVLGLGWSIPNSWKKAKKKEKKKKRRRRIKMYVEKKHKVE